MGTHQNVLAVSDSKVEEALLAKASEREGRVVTEIFMVCILKDPNVEEVIAKLPAGSWAAYVWCFEEDCYPRAIAVCVESLGEGKEPSTRLVRYQASRKGKDSILELDDDRRVIPGARREVPSLCR